jgi:hypothetical protein
MKLLIFISLLVILLLYRKYIAIANIDRTILNSFWLKNKNFNSISYQLMKQANIPENIIFNVSDVGNINNILQYIDIEDQNNYSVIYEFKRVNKIIIIISGENGSGKTNLMFQMYSYFNNSHDIILATLDHYKRNYYEFITYAHDNNTDIFSPIYQILDLKKSFHMYFQDFLLTQYTMLIIDTSGRADNNHKLQQEMSAFLKYVRNECTKENVKSIFIYNFSGLKTIHVPSNIHQYNYSTISQIDRNFIYYNQISTIVTRHQLLFLSLSSNFTDLYLYSNMLLAEMISKKMQNIIDNIK